MSTSVAIDHSTTEPEERPRKLPRIEPDTAAAGAGEARNPMFELLVRDEGDAAGLLAYALYKQNKRDWLIAFQESHGRPPAEGETEAFILGERIERRIGTYRRLAEEMLRKEAGARPAQRLSPLPTQASVQTPANDAGRSGMSSPARPKLAWRQAWRPIALMLLGLVAMAVVFRLAGAWLFR
jgi:hypothetical protein